MRIAHFSDTHLLSLRNVKAIAFVGKRVTGGLNLLLHRGREYSLAVGRRLIADINEQAPDHVVISGDVSNLALPAEFELVGEVLRGLTLPASAITVVPGNHDYYTLDTAWRADFTRILAPFIEADIAPVGCPFPFARLRGEAAIIGLSTARPSAPLLAIGTVGQRQLRRAEMLLEHPQVKDKFRILVLHHPPRSRHVEWHARLTDAAPLMRTLARTGAELVLHGHLHRNVCEHVDGPRRPVPVIGVTSGTWLSPRDPDRRAAYNIYTIEHGRLTGITARRYDLVSDSFGA